MIMQRRSQGNRVRLCVALQGCVWPCCLLLRRARHATELSASWLECCCCSSIRPGQEAQHSEH
jgi:hypothetical protein